VGAPVAYGILAGSPSVSWATIHKEAASSDFSRFRRHPPVVRPAQLCRPSRSRPSSPGTTSATARRSRGRSASRVARLLQNAMPSLLAVERRQTRRCCRSRRPSSALTSTSSRTIASRRIQSPPRLALASALVAKRSSDAGACDDPCSAKASAVTLGVIVSCAQFGSIVSERSAIARSPASACWNAQGQLTQEVVSSRSAERLHRQWLGLPPALHPWARMPRRLGPRIVSFVVDASRG